jgi:hypothetical protein
MSMVLFGDGAGLFNADSARVPIRTVIRQLAATAKKIKLREPLDIFHYHDRVIRIESAWQVWP